MESRQYGQDKRIFFCPVHNASTPCSLQAFGIRCIPGSKFLKFGPFTTVLLVAKFLDKADDQFPFRKRCMQFITCIVDDISNNSRCRL